MGKRKRTGTDASTGISAERPKKIKHDENLNTPKLHLDPNQQSAHVNPQNANKAKRAVASGDAEAINAGLPPPGLSKRRKAKWKSAQRASAIQKSIVPHDDSSRADEAQASHERKKRKRERRRQRRRDLLAVGSQSGTKDITDHTTDTSNAAEMVAETAQAMDVKSIAFTRLMLPPKKAWDESQSPVPSQPFQLPSKLEQSRSEREAVQRRYACSEAEGFADFTIEKSQPRPVENASSTQAKDLRSRPSVTNMTAKSLLGNRNFDVPDYFSGGNLADTERQFEAWARRARGGRNDSSDSSDSESDDSDEDEQVAEAPAIRGSIHESWAEAIYKDHTDGMVIDTQPRAIVTSSENDEEAAPLQMSIKSEIQALDREHEDSSRVRDIDSTHDDAGLEGEVIDESKVVLPADSAEEVAADASSSEHRPSGTTNGMSASTRQANVHVKRILSPVDLGCNGSGLGLSDSPKRTSHESVILVSGNVPPNKDEIDKGELSDDLYSTIDDVTHDLLGKENILSLNECKPPNAPDLQNRLEKDPLITTVASTCHPTSLDVEEEHDQGANVAFKESVSIGRHKLHSTSTTTLDVHNHTDDPPERNVPKSAKMLLEELPGRISLCTTLTHSSPEEKKSRRMTGRSSKHFSAMKRARIIGKPVAETVVTTPPPETLNPRPPEQDCSDTVLKRTRSGNSTRRQADSEVESTLTERADTSLARKGREIASDTPVSELSPLTSLEEALEKVSRMAASRATITLHAQVEEDVPLVTEQGKVLAHGAKPYATPNATPQDAIGSLQTPQSLGSKAVTPRPKRSTGRISTHFITDRVDLYNTTSSGKRVPAGTSVVPVPSIHADKFGIVQEKLWREPFWLLIAVTFLNKTAGRSAMPIFWKLRERYPTPDALATADQAELMTMVYKLGLQVQRSRRLIKIATMWRDDPPQLGRRFRTLHYPNHGDGKSKDVASVVNEDAQDCRGALEIGHVPGCKDYAYDSWRMFCRDVFRGVADDYNGLNAKAQDFEPEWQRVLPEDKELRACMRWMWLREGWIWEPLTGEKRRATQEEMAKAEKGEMEIADPHERRFAVLAAAGNEGMIEDIVDMTPSRSSKRLEVEAVNTPAKVEEAHETMPSPDLERSSVAKLEEDDHQSHANAILPARRRGRARAAKAVPGITVDEHPADPIQRPAERKAQDDESGGQSQGTPSLPPRTHRRTKTRRAQADDAADRDKRTPRRRSARSTT